MEAVAEDQDMDLEGAAFTQEEGALLDELAERIVHRMDSRSQVQSLDQKSAKLQIEIDKEAVLAIAAVCHAANREYCHHFTGEEHLSWEQAPDWQRESAIEGVRKHLDGGHMGPEQSHSSWMSHKLRDGWRYGEVKDAEAKTHPCLLPYDELPLEQQLKDHLFSGIVRALTPLAIPLYRQKMASAGVSGTLGRY